MLVDSFTMNLDYQDEADRINRMMERRGTEDARVDAEDVRNMIEKIGYGTKITISRPAGINGLVDPTTITNAMLKLSDGKRAIYSVIYYYTDPNDMMGYLLKGSPLAITNVSVVKRTEVKSDTSTIALTKPLFIPAFYLWI